MEQQGFCGFSPLQSAGEAGPCIGQSSMSLSITSTTGSPVELIVPRGETVDSLRTRISQKLSLQSDRMVLVHKDRLLTAGTLMDQGVRDGSRLTLVPATETGLMFLNGKERTMMDTLECLTETQIDDFLSGRSPLTLSVGTGARTMCVQLQLSQDVKRMQEDKEPQLTSDSPDSSSSQFFTPQSSSAPSLSTPSSQCSSHRPRTSFSSSKSVPPVSCPSSVLRSRSAPFPHVICPAPVCSDRPSSSITCTDPLSPAAASTATEADVKEHLSQQPGAVIESFVRHSPGVFSGTFSGTLASCSQSHISHQRRGTAIILQILNDLLRAAFHHQEAPTLPPPLHHCGSSEPPVRQVKAEEPRRARNRPQRTGLGGAEGQLPPPSEENQSLQSKLKRLQLLMRLQRLRSWTRRRSRLHKATPPYLQRHNCS